MRGVSWALAAAGMMVLAGPARADSQPVPCALLLPLGTIGEDASPASPVSCRITAGLFEGWTLFGTLQGPQRIQFLQATLPPPATQSLAFAPGTPASHVFAATFTAFRHLPVGDVLAVFGLPQTPDALLEHVHPGQTGLP